MAHYFFANTPHGCRADGTKLDTNRHYNYICREGEYAHMRGREEDLVYTCSRNMPDWAKNPGEFWKTADLYRRANGRSYREIRLGLQEELSLKDNIELIETFLEKSGIGKKHAFSYAIHDKTAAFDKSHRNIHAHIMFCEKVIEKDRPLGPESYFKQYSENRDGIPTAGYKCERFYHDKTGTYVMRKMWADIVNAKFEELGIERSVTEKSLKAQYQEALEKGDTEQAELLNRQAAPHLGKAYRNPKQRERIQEVVDIVTAQADYPGCSQDEADETDEQDTIDKQKIVMFATDLVLRRITKEIEREQKRLREEEIQRLEAQIAAGKDDAEAAELAAQPVVVTVEDLLLAMREKEHDLELKKDAYLKEYRTIKGKIIPEKLLQSVAIERVMGSEYRNARKAYAQISKELEPLKQKHKELLHVPYKDKKDVEHQYAVAIAKRREVWKQLKEMKDWLAGEGKEAVNAAVNELKKQNEVYDTAARKAYGKYKWQEKLLHQHIEKREALENMGFPNHHIVYSRHLPRRVLRNCTFTDEAIHTTKSLKEMEMIVSQGKAYIVLPNQPESAPRKAVLLGDSLRKGMATVYSLNCQTDDKGQQIYTATKTEEEVPLYSGQTKTTGTAKGPKAHAVQTQQRHDGQSHLKQLVEKAVEPANGKYHAWWEDEEEIHRRKDEVERAEEEMARSWSM